MTDGGFSDDVMDIELLRLDRIAPAEMTADAFARVAAAFVAAARDQTR
jgi:hypothetical protein